MEPIIPLWIIYALDRVEAVQVLFGFGGTIGLLVGAFFMSYAFIEDGPLPLKIISIVATSICLFSILLATVIPSRTGIIQMAISSKVTTENVTSVLELGNKIKDEAKEDVLDIINMVKSKSTEEK